MSITVVNLQDNQAVFRIFITLLRFSFDSPLYLFHDKTLSQFTLHIPTPTQTTYIQHSYDCRGQCYSISLRSHTILDCINLLTVVMQLLIKIIALVAWC